MKIHVVKLSNGAELRVPLSADGKPMWTDAQCRRAAEFNGYTLLVVPVVKGKL